MGIRLSEWQCKLENSILEEIKLLVIYVQLKHCWLIWHRSICSGMEDLDSERLPKNVGLWDRYLLKNLIKLEWWW